MANTHHRVDCSTGEITSEPFTPEEEDNLAQGQTDAVDQRFAEQWGTVESVRGMQLRQTDALIEPFAADMPNNIQNQIKDHEQEWLDFRQALRDIPQNFDYPNSDPELVEWPDLPAAPRISITPPPDFVQWDWSANYVPVT